MPERPKRKNKNKNKRKNKTNRVDNSKNNSGVVENENEESCSVQLSNDGAEVDLNEHSKTTQAETQSNENIVVPNENVLELDCSGIISTQVCTNEDVNNNSRTVTVDTLEVPPPNICIAGEEVIEEQGCETYIVESPEQSLKSNPKLSNGNKSKSLDNDDATKIVDITEDTLQSEDESTLALVDTSNVLVSDIESDIEWEKTEDVKVSTIKDNATEAMSVSTLPLNVAQCQQINVSLSPDIETSLRSYLHTLDLSTHPENSIEIKAEIEQIINREIRHRLRKKGLADDIGLQRLAPPRKLDVIDEESSSESSKSSRRQSYLRDKKSDNEDLEDDVFEDNKKKQEKVAKRVETTLHKRTFGRLIPQQCVLVDAKIKQPEITEARGDWTMQTVEKLTGAELVYLTDSSSSTSSLHDNGDETDDGMETDVSVRIITPTIEVTDTEHLLKKSFIARKQNDLQDFQENKSKDHTIVSVNFEKDNNIIKDDKNASLFHNPNEIVILSTDNIKTNLYVKDVENIPVIDENKETSVQNLNTCEENTQRTGDKYDLEIKVLKCELNDAINNLIKEVSDSEQNENSTDTFSRQDSSSSVCSSQCTAKYNPTSSSLNDVSNILHDDTTVTIKANSEHHDDRSVSSHVKDVFEHVAGATTADNNKLDVITKEPSHLRDLCVKRIALFPYGDKILEELASVSKRIQKIAGAFATEETDDNNSQLSNVKEVSKDNKMPYYPLPDLSPIEKVLLPLKVKETVPPPVKPRHSSLKKKSREEEVWTGVPTKTEPVYVCLSPSQKMLMEKTQTVITKEDASELVDMHKKYVDRRGYNENYSKEKQARTSPDDVSPIVPFKSQTGSRLLALIRDPGVTKNVLSPNKYSNLDQNIEKKLSVTQTTSTKHQNVVNYSNSANTFRPIPPPRPKKLSSSYYESDESSDFTDNSMRSIKKEKKIFHFSTGNLNKEIEDDISSIQNMHRYYTNTRDSLCDTPRRPSLPKDLCDQQMEYIRQKEKEVEAEIQRLESIKNNAPSSLKQKVGPRAPLLTDKEVIEDKVNDANNYFVSKRRDFFASLSAPEKQENLFSSSNHKLEKGKLSSVFSSSQEELLREKMYSEYVTQMAQREERKQHKVIKITNTPITTTTKISKSMPLINHLDSKVNNRIEKEFISKARERWDKLGIMDPETEDEREATNDVYREPKVIEHKIKVIESGQEKDVTNLPRHLQEFVRFTAKDKEQSNSSSGESKSEPASPHVMILCAVIIIVLAVGKYFLRLLRNK